MANIGNFNANDVDPAQEYRPVPPGDYIAQIVRSEWKPTKKNDGHYVEMEMDILDGAETGKKLFDRLNLDNQNAQAVEIAQRTLSAICHATGVMQVSDTEQLHFKPMAVSVKVKERQDKPGQFSNEIGGYKPVSQAGGQAPAPRPAPQGHPPQTATPSAPAPAAPPWGGQAQGGSAPATPPWKKTA